VVLLIGFAWMNYAWILWNMPEWKHRLEALAIRIRGDDFQRQSRSLSGSTAEECGGVRVRKNPASASGCALKAFLLGRLPSCCSL